MSIGAPPKTEPLRPMVPLPVADDEEAADYDPTTYGDVLRGAGAYRNDRGQLVHDVRRHDGTTRRNGQLYAVVLTTERRVALSREEALRRGWDYYHPEHGWFRNGFKREQEHAENLGAAQTGLAITYEPLAEPDDPHAPALENAAVAEYEPVEVELGQPARPRRRAKEQEEV